MDRIDKVMSGLGLLSRSECKKAIKQGLIQINGEICKSAEFKVDPDIDEIIYKGEKVNSASFVYYMFNKPDGVVTAKEDKHDRTVFDYISDTRTDLAAVGRLDKDTTGLLLITNDGALNHYLLSPKHHVEKLYEVLIEGKLIASEIRNLEIGVDIGDDTPTLPAKVEVVSENEDSQMVFLTITEGRFHQVKRMFAAVGHPVLKLHRSGFGTLILDKKLAQGEIRELTEEELKSLKEL